MIRIVPYHADYHDRLGAIWLRSVQATHHFLTPEDIAFFLPIVRDHAFTSAEVYVALNARNQPVGFIGFDGPKVEMLFIDPDFHRQGIGRTCLDFAVSQKGNLILDVNEQNPQAVRFYLAYGFVQTGRSPVDSMGKPFPLLHLAFTAG